MPTKLRTYTRAEVEAVEARVRAMDPQLVETAPSFGYVQLLARRIPPDAIEPGRAYVIFARNGAAGVALRAEGELRYRLHREKFGRVYLFDEVDWNHGPPFGTAIPLAEIADRPPEGDDERLLAWLLDQETLHAAEVLEAWQLVLPSITEVKLR